MLDDTFVKNLVQFGQETAEKRWREKKKRKEKKANRQRLIILPQILKNFIFTKTVI